MFSEENLTDLSVGQEMPRRLMVKEVEELDSAKESVCETTDTCYHIVFMCGIRTYMCLCVCVL